MHSALSQGLPTFVSKIHQIILRGRQVVVVPQQEELKETPAHLDILFGEQIVLERWVIGLELESVTEYAYIPICYIDPWTYPNDAWQNSQGRYERVSSSVAVALLVPPVNAPGILLEIRSPLSTHSILVCIYACDKLSRQCN